MLNESDAQLLAVCCGCYIKKEQTPQVGHLFSSRLREHEGRSRGQGRMLQDSGHEGPSCLWTYCNCVCLHTVQPGNIPAWMGWGGSQGPTSSWGAVDSGWPLGKGQSVCSGVVSKLLLCQWAALYLRLGAALTGPWLIKEKKQRMWNWERDRGEVGGGKVEWIWSNCIVYVYDKPGGGVVVSLTSGVAARSLAVGRMSHSRCPLQPCFPHLIRDKPLSPNRVKPRERWLLLPGFSDDHC